MFYFSNFSNYRNVWLLLIPASSVASKRLFSDAENQISCKRTRFGLNLVSKMLFIKRNDEYIDMFKEK